MEIELKTVEGNQIASISHVGRVEEMGELIGELTGWIMQKGLKMTQAPFVVYYTSPMEVPPEKMQYEVGIPFQGDSTEDDRVKIKIMPKHQVLSAIYKGPYENIAPIYAAMMQYIMKENLEMIGAPREVYLNSPAEVSENELLTEVLFPVFSLQDYNELNPSTETVKLVEKPQNDSYRISPIGYVRKEGQNITLEILDPYNPGLKELENFSHVMVLWWADKVDNDDFRTILQTYPPYSLDRLTGVFATRAEYRPNPIALCTCRILDVNEQEGIVNVANLDADDRTPIMDLKPYIPSFDRVKEPELPKWLSFLWPEWMHEQ